MSQPPIQPPASDHLRLLQINLNKSEAAQLELINDELSNNYDIILIQEPHTTTFGNIRTPNQFRQVYPGGRHDPNTKVRSGIWVNRNIDTGCWKELPIPNTGDITAIQLTGKYGRLSIFNIYNPCENNSAEAKLHQYLQTQGPDIHMGATDHMIWAGDFNRHHPLWDRAEDVHLFTRAATNAADQLHQENRIYIIEDKSLRIILDYLELSLNSANLINLHSLLNQTGPSKLSVNRW